MMTAASDKARFYLEQTVPELQEWQRKNLFSRDEIRSITQKRSEFEHILNMGGQATPAHYVRYVEYEMNLDQVRKRRSHRLHIKSKSYVGQRRVFFILDRGTRKFPDNIPLWIMYLEFCRRQEANKKLEEAFSRCARLLPNKWEIWAWMAKFYVEQQGDVTKARDVMLRGLRFCKRERDLWLEFCKLEMIHVAKVAARRRILGLDEQREKKVDDDELLDADADTIALPDITGAELQPEAPAVDDEVLEKLATSPALSGEIARAVFDNAMREFDNDATLIDDFAAVFALFRDTPCTERLIRHVLDSCSDSTEAAKVVRQVGLARLELLDSPPQDAAASAQFPVKLGRVIALLKSAPAGRLLAERSLLLLLPYLAAGQILDEDVARVLQVVATQQARDLTKSSVKLLSKKVQQPAELDVLEKLVNQ